MLSDKFFAAGLVFLAAVPAFAQSFTTMVVRRAQADSLESRRVRVLPNGELIATSANAISFLSFAYEVPDNPSDRLKGLPDWAFTQRYDIQAKASLPSAVFATGADSEASVREMFRRILKEQFHLVMRTEMKRVPAYALVAVADVLKPQQAKGLDCVYDTAATGCHTFEIGFGHPLNGNAVTMDDLAHYIENWTDRPVVNRTGLHGVYTTTSQGWLPMRLPPPPPNGLGNVDFSHLESLASALKGLGLELRKETVELPEYTVESMRQPVLEENKEQPAP
jgi:uncharacterized protein (TIGR03435 family)